MTKILGLTGGIASGKSLVSRYFLDHGIAVADGDVLARAVVAPNSPTLKKIVAHFGPTIVKAGVLQRKKLAQIVFADKEELATLNALMRVALIAAFETAIADAKKQNLPLLVLDIPLLFEQGYDRYCDQVMVIFVDEATQLTRLQARDNLSATEAKKRIAAQMPLREKIARADVVINNNGTPAETLQQVDVWCQQQAQNAKF